MNLPQPFHLAPDRPTLSTPRPHFLTERTRPDEGLVEVLPRQRLVVGRRLHVTWPCDEELLSHD